MVYFLWSNYFRGSLLICGELNEHIIILAQKIDKKFFVYKLVDADGRKIIEKGDCTKTLFRKVIVIIKMTPVFLLESNISLFNFKTCAIFDFVCSIK